jgi:hypothetical protein
MSRTLLQEIVHQIFGSSPRNSRRSTRKPNHGDYERELYKLKLAAFENRKSYEQAQHLAKSKGWTK